MVWCCWTSRDYGKSICEVGSVLPASHRAMQIRHRCICGPKAHDGGVLLSQWPEGKHQSNFLELPFEMRRRLVPSITLLRRRKRSVLGWSRWSMESVEEIRPLRSDDGIGPHMAVLTEHYRGAGVPSCRRAPGCQASRSFMVRLSWLLLADSGGVCCVTTWGVTIGSLELLCS
jgi:hypothetical protein